MRRTFFSRWDPAQHRRNPGYMCGGIDAGRCFLLATAGYIGSIEATCERAQIDFLRISVKSASFSISNAVLASHSSSVYAYTCLLR